MGRGKLSMKLIASEKSRKMTFHKRKKSLMRKAYELSTLCDVRTCVLIYGPSQNDHQSANEVHTWPSNRNEILDMIDAYKTNCLQKRSRKCFGLDDFFAERKKRIEAELSKLRKDAAEIKHPKWDQRLEYLLEDQLRLLLDDLDSKIDIAQRTIDSMEQVQDQEQDYDHHYMIGEGTSTMVNGFPFPAESSSQNLNSNFKQEFLSNSTFETQFPFHYKINTEDAPQIPTMNQNQFMGNSVPMMPIDHGIDLSNFLFGSNGAQFQYNYGNLQAHIFNDPANRTLESHNMSLGNPNYSIYQNAMTSQSFQPLSYLQYTQQMPCASNSQMMNDASIQAHNQFDYLDFEYLMKINNY